MHYLKFKILYCSQTDKEIFAIIDIHEKLKHKHRLMAFSCPSWQVEINEKIKIDEDCSLELIVTQLINTIISENIKLYDTYSLDSKIVGAIPTKNRVSKVVVNGNHVSLMINKTAVQLKINSIDVLKTEYSIGVNYTNAVPIEIESFGSLIDYYGININLISILGARIFSKKVIETHDKAFLTPIRYMRLKDYKDDSLYTLENYTLQHLSYYEVESYVTLDMLGSETLLSMQDFNILNDSLKKN